MGITTDECLISGMSNKYWKYTEEESKAIITRYNGNATEENPEYEKVLNMERKCLIILEYLAKSTKSKVRKIILITFSVFILICIFLKSYFG